ncbi:MAG TPA: type IX secretion system membrane protein PorP/SprF [Prolixibacteraceae bacterium]|nr:type IX secretion system membrane protein PorP/SprF [Prolixibacteraceae bacterium]
MKKLYIFLLLMLGLTAYGQQDPLFTQYMFNKLLVNAAFAGSREVTTIDVLNRSQWVGIDGAPNTLTFSMHTLMPNRRVGLGFYGYRDALGPNVNQGLMATYAYRILLDRSSFAFGLQAGFKHFNFDWDMIRVKYPEDYYFLPQEVQRWAPDFNLGMYFQSDRFYAGLSSKQLLENEYGTIKASDGHSTFSRLLRHYYAMAGYRMPLDDRIIFRPSFLVKYVKNAPVQIDLNASVVFNDFFWIGASFRTQKAIAFMTEFSITPKIRLGYSLDIYLNELQPFNYGSHEIRVGFDLVSEKNRMKTPRYF